MFLGGPNLYILGIRVNSLTVYFRGHKLHLTEGQTFSGETP